MATSAQVEKGAALLKEKLDRYCNAYPREELYMHTDRGSYISGETLWFAVYAVEWKTLLPSGISRIAYVELLNYDNRPVVRKSILLEGGAGPGDIVLPDTLSSGIYMLRAYTAWMKNFLPGNCFKKEITIYNALGSNTLLKKPRIHASEIHKQCEDIKSGLHLTADNSETDNLDLVIIADSNFTGAKNMLCHLLIETRGNVSVAEDIVLAGETTSRSISKTSLLPGVNHIALLAPSGTCLAQRYIYIPPAPGKDALISSSDTFEKRDNISLEIRNGTPTGRNLSVSIVPAGSDQFPDFPGYMVFGSEYGSDIAQKAAKLQEMEVNEIDDLLLNARSDYIDWNNIVSGVNPLIKYHPEKENHYLRGKLINSNGPGSRVIMSIPGKSAIFQYSETESDGSFAFEMPADNKMREIILEPDDINGTTSIKIESPFLEDYSASGHMTDTVEGTTAAAGVNYQVRKIYGLMNSGPEDSLPIKPPQVKRFYGKPDIGLVLADYIKLPTMDEIFFEIIPGTTLKRRKTGYEIEVSDPVTNLVYDHKPTLFVDGVMISDAAVIANLDPEYVEEIDVVRERYIVGDYIFTGIVNVITKAGDFSSVTLPDYAVRTYYMVIDPVKRFISPDYSEPVQRKSRIPDFRNTLWWNPAMPSYKVAEIWSSDISGEYKIMVNGFGEDGRPVSSEKIIRIK